MAGALFSALPAGPRLLPCTADPLPPAFQHRSRFTITEFRAGQLPAREPPLTTTGQTPTPGGNMLWTIFAILLILWLLGWGFHIAGGLIHILLVIALVVAIINLASGRRAVD